VASPPRLTGFDGVARDEFIHDGSLALGGPQQPTHALDVLTLPEGAANDHRDVGVGDVQPLVEYSRGHEGPEIPSAKALQGIVALGTADVAGQGHDEVLARDGVRGVVVGGEDQHPGGPVAIQKGCQCSPLGPCEGEKPSHLAPREKGATPLCRTACMASEVRPASTWRHPAEVRMGRGEHSRQPRVDDAFVGLEIHVQRDRIEARQKSAGEIRDAELKDGRSNELCEAGRHRGVTRGCRRETEAGLGDRHLERLVAKSTAEVMNFIDDDEIEAISEPVHVSVRALVSRDGQGRPPAQSVAIAADRSPVQCPDFPKPLIEQNPRRDQAYGTQPGPLHGGEGQSRLTASSGQSDDAPAMPQLPRGQRRILIRPEVHIRPELLRQQ